MSKNPPDDAKPKPQPQPMRPATDEEIARLKKAHEFWSDPHVQHWIEARERLDDELRAQAERARAERESRQ